MYQTASMRPNTDREAQYTRQRTRLSFMEQVMRVKTVHLPLQWQLENFPSETAEIRLLPRAHQATEAVRTV